MKPPQVRGGFWIFLFPCLIFYHRLKTKHDPDKFLLKKMYFLKIFSILLNLKNTWQISLCWLHYILLLISDFQTRSVFFINHDTVKKMFWWKENITFLALISQYRIIPWHQWESVKHRTFFIDHLARRESTVWHRPTWSCLMTKRSRNMNLLNFSITTFPYYLEMTYFENICINITYCKITNMLCAHKILITALLCNSLNTWFSICNVFQTLPRLLHHKKTVNWTM